MFLYMARIVRRKDDPQIGLYWVKAADEGTEHAAGFTESLGLLEKSCK